MESVSFLTWLEERMSLEELASASGLLVEVKIAGDPTWSQLIGPYPVDGVGAYEAIETLRSEEDPEAPPNNYSVRLLFPTTSAVKS